MLKKKTGVLLINLGTPDTCSPGDVYRYLIEFLTDERVIDTSWLKRQLLVRGLIVPFRYRKSAKAYQSIWTKEGSPLKVYGYQVKEKLQKMLGDTYHIELAMRYQNPSIEKGLDTLMKAGVDDLLILPLFPQYASATTGSVHQKVMELVCRYQVIPEIRFVNEYATHPKLIEAFCAAASGVSLGSYDHILFSFHGLPERHVMKADKQSHCLKAPGCCEQLTRRNQSCYSAQCHATAKALACALQLPKGQHSVVFQSRLGKDPWLQPYFSTSIVRLAKEGKKRVLVFCPSFVSDCLETIDEIGVEYAAEFKKAGGESLGLVPGLNCHPKWIEALASIVKENGGSSTNPPLSESNLPKMACCMRERL